MNEITQGESHEHCDVPFTLAAIDGMRHLIVSEDIVAAVAFAVRAGSDNRTACRFVTALVMRNALTGPARWDDLLRMVMDLESGDA